MLSKVIQIIDSRKLEYLGIAFLITAIGFGFIGGFGKIQSLLTLFLIFLYLIRIFTSFQQWKFSKGISLFNAFLNYQIAFEVSAIAFTLQKWTGAPELAILVGLLICLILYYGLQMDANFSDYKY
jgi:hypothetical protein